MKYIISCLLIVVAACSPKQPEQNVDSQIASVENGLIRSVYIEGDSVWSIQDRMKHYGVPGVSIAVIKDNKIAWTKAYGIMDKETNEPVTTRTLFQAGSISKPVAAYGALKMVELGKLSLTENVNNYLTSWKLADNEFTKDKKVNLTHLVSHTGGLTVHGFGGYPPGDPVPTLVQVLDGTAPANSPAIFVDKEPGGNFRYSGGGYCIMQQMMIDVHGKSFPEIEKELVLGPLDMTSSTYDQPLDADMVKLAATGYLPDHRQTLGKRHTYPEMAAAGLWTTAEDLAKFAIDVQLTLKGESTKVLSKDMVEKMLAPVDGNFIGLGLFINDKKGEIYFGHGGWDEGFSSEMIAHKDKGYGVVVLTNSNHPQFISEVMRSVARAYNWDNYVDSHKKLAMDTSLFKSVTGRYKNGSDGTLAITRDGDRLFFKNLRAESPAELFRVSDSTYLTFYENASIQFKNKSDGSIDIIRYAGNDAVSHDRMRDDEKVPFEFLIAGDFDTALKRYKDLAKTNDEAASEDVMNRRGYDLLRGGKSKLAQDVFKINTILYPNSANVYDSYGDACKASGDNKAAIESYKKALKLNPKNDESARKLAELENVSK